MHLQYSLCAAKRGFTEVTSAKSSGKFNENENQIIIRFDYQLNSILHALGWFDRFKESS